MSVKTPSGKIIRSTGKGLAGLAMAAALTFLLLLLAGFFKEKVPSEAATPARPVPAQAAVAEVRALRLPQFETAVGTVRAVHESAVAAKLLARVTAVNVKAGQTVTKGQVLVTLDDADLQARVKQAEAAAQSAQANLEKTQADFLRAEQLRPTNAISKEEYDRAAALFRTAQAEVLRSAQAIKEAQVLLDYATIRAPMTGVVIDKKVEAGDTVAPGQTLLSLFDPSRMQLVVSVRESLAQRLQVGQRIKGRLDALDLECEATISEIVPEAQAASRSFTVKVTGPCPPGAFSGMFGRVFIPLGEEEVVIVPHAAVFHIGQLNMAEVVQSGRLTRRHLQLGRFLEGGYEVLAGLKPGEKVLLHSTPTKEVQG